jgi:hypothetical protein
MAVATESRLIIVRRDHKHLCERLAGEHSEADVILDRRRVDVPREPERRQALSPPEHDMWERFGYRIVYRPPVIG